MSTLAADMAFDFAYPSCEIPANFSFDPSLLDIPFNAGHGRSSSRGSVYSMASNADSIADTASTRMSTPSRASPPVHHRGPILLPKIRSQDQALDQSPAKRLKTTSPPARAIPKRASASATFRPSHARSFTNPETISWGMPFYPQADDMNTSLLCSPVAFAEDDEFDFSSRRASTCNLDDTAIEKFGFPTYRQMPSYIQAPTPAPVQQQQHLQQQPVDAFNFSSYAPRAPSPLSVSSTPDPVATTTLHEYLTASNPAPSLVRTVSFPMRDPQAKNFWWDVRQVRPWSSFNLETILSLPGAATLLHCPVPAPLLPMPAASARHPETESALHAIYAAHYLPRLNAALALSSTTPLSLSLAPKTSATSANAEPLFLATCSTDATSAAAIFGGNPTARAVGLVRAFDRFNTGMRSASPVARVEYLRGLAAIHHAMRAHGTRYGFIMTEIELVIVRNGNERTPHFGFLEVCAVPLAGGDGESELTACLALWGLCVMAGDAAGAWKAEIGAPAEGTRRKALARDSWMPTPQLAEKREAKRARGWVWPEDAVGRKELGKRGVRYGGV
ncbi:hypothetical protein HYQ45_012093 [Verticillium longisporum]|uniref:Sialidase n=1 Tax=Verticillium longisporum TaxID=100787 RepID=A0A8I2ZEJ1_VERLO|nr:hypothetical protein HYQ44_018420 [Verticillium longisporum]KAG7128153.1 hypothetical protein HYQ45_012093 [Verticillium longisporum]